MTRIASRRPRGAAAPRRREPRRWRRSQAGVVLLLMLIVLVVGSMFFLVNGLSDASAEAVASASDSADARALREARDALIAYSALRPGPGHLPCPDLDNDGVSEGIACGTAATRVGRLPWKTLGLPDLRDSSGERLWYAVSRCFLARTPDGTCTYQVNSDTPGGLTIVGLAPANNVIAIIFAPGAALAAQDRSAAGINAVSNYLEGENGDGANDTYVADRAQPGFNDRLLAINGADLFPVVENVVADRIKKEVLPALESYRSRWGFLPYAAPFNDAASTPATPARAQVAFRGYGSANAASTNEGLLPVSQDATWSTLVSPVVVNAGPGPGTVTAGSCSLASGSATPTDTSDIASISCTITYTGTPDVGITGTITGIAGTTLAVPIDLSKATYSGTPWTAPLMLSQSPSATNGDLAFSFRARMPAGPPYTTTITIPLYSALLEPTVTDLSWFLDNRWYAVTYYAAAAGFLNGSGASCAGTCFTVNGPGGSITPGERLVLVLAGRAIDGSTRPSGTLANYFEGQNANPFDRTFQSGSRTPSFNDRIVMSP